MHQERLDGGTARRITGGARARGENELGAGDLVRLGEASGKRPKEGGRIVFGSNVTRNDRELVGTEACDEYAGSTQVRLLVTSLD